MTVTETTAKSLLRRYKRVDSWFIASAGMNLYRGCAHGCLYCDGFAEQYRLSGELGKDVEVKINALDLLRGELSAKRRVPLKGGFVALGGGVTDTWQPVDKTYALARGALTLLLEKRLPVHALTKSDLILRDLDLIQAIHRERRAIVSLSFSSVNSAIAAIVEPGAPNPKRRLEVLRAVKAAGVPCGMFLMPVIPGLTDTESELSATLEAAKDAGLDYVVFAGLTLKPGRQHDRFLALVTEKWPALVDGYRKIYTGDRYGSPIQGYVDKLHRRFYPIADHLGLSVRIPDTVFGDILSPTEKVIVMLEHLDYVTVQQGKASFYGVAARSIAQSKQEIGALMDGLPRLKGVGPFTARIIREIVETGTSQYYRKLLHASPC